VASVYTRNGFRFSRTASWTLRVGESGRPRVVLSSTNERHPDKIPHPQQGKNGGYPPAIRSDVASVGQDLLVAGSELQLAFSRHHSCRAGNQIRFFDLQFMYWFVIPAGAICSGFAAASGYYAGARYFNHRPTKLLLLNMVVISIATFFLIHYINYYFLIIDGRQVRELVDFARYLDSSFRTPPCDSA